MNVKKYNFTILFLNFENLMGLFCKYSQNSLNCNAKKYVLEQNTLWNI